ncbi:hypothetical protein DFH28DRAFT_1217603 [Melampsora americana]|nr:hypothetical protein DFH28DRAFT_1217603 [Melampsora americana]
MKSESINVQIKSKTEEAKLNSIKPESIPLPSSPIQSINTLSSPHSINLNTINPNTINPITINPSSSASSSSSPPSSSLSEKRNTSTSRYLDSNDFKSNFVLKLNSLREKEKETHPLHSIDEPFTHSNHQSNPTFTPPSNHHSVHQSNTLHSSSLSPDLEPTRSDLNSTSSNPLLSPPILLESLSLQSVHQENAKNLSDSNPSSSSQLGYDSETDTLASKADLQKDLSFQTSSKTNDSNHSKVEFEDEKEDEKEDESARNEVIEKLATDLAQQIDKFDKLSFDFGLLRATHASLQSVAIDTADELACLREHTKLLLDGHDFFECDQRKEDSEGLIQSLNQELLLTRRTICRLHLQLYPSQPIPTEALDSIKSPGSENPSVIIDQPRTELSQSTQSSSDCMTPSSIASSLPTPVSPSLPDETNLIEECPVDCQAVNNLRAKVAQLESQLSECQESRMISETTLKAFQQVFNPNLISNFISEPKPHPPNPSPRWGLNLLLHRPNSLSHPPSTNREPIKANDEKMDSSNLIQSKLSNTSSTFGFSTPWKTKRHTLESNQTSPSFNIGKLFGNLVSPSSFTTTHHLSTVMTKESDEEKVREEKVKDQVEDQIELDHDHEEKQEEDELEGSEVEKSLNGLKVEGIERNRSVLEIQS